MQLSPHAPCGRAASWGHSGGSARAAQLARRSGAAVPGCRRSSAGVGGSSSSSRRGSSSLVARAGEEALGDWYCTVGLSHCFKKGDDGRLADVMVIEPISSSSLECMAAGAKTSFRHVTGLALADAAARSRDRLPAPFADGVFCEDWGARLEAAARTWQRPHAQDNLMDIVPLGKVRSEFNFSLDNKRVLNMEAVVTDDDNVKQDMSIDVYGRADKKARDEAMAKAAKAEAEAAEKSKAAAEEDELDALLAA